MEEGGDIVVGTKHLKSPMVVDLGLAPEDRLAEWGGGREEIWSR